MARGIGQCGIGAVPYNAVPGPHGPGSNRKNDPCPFLVDDACAVHPLRPMACRQFNALDTPCAVGEDAVHTRRGDVLTPPQRYVDEALMLLLPLVGIQGEAARREMVALGRHHALAQVLQALDWTRLAGRMDAEDAAAGGALIRVNAAPRARRMLATSMRRCPMYLRHRGSGDAVEVLELTGLFDPFAREITGRFHAGEEMQEPAAFRKAELVFPSGEPLPRCWIDPHYRSIAA